MKNVIGIFFAAAMVAASVRQDSFASKDSAQLNWQLMVSGARGSGEQRNSYPSPQCHPSGLSVSGHVLNRLGSVRLEWCVKDPGDLALSAVRDSYECRAPGLAQIENGRATCDVEGSRHSNPSTCKRLICTKGVGISLCVGKSIEKSGLPCREVSRIAQSVLQKCTVSESLCHPLSFPSNRMFSEPQALVL